MRTRDEIERYLRMAKAILAGPDMPHKPTDALHGEIAAIEWVLGQRDDPPGFAHVELLEKILKG
jgi:hypothetical protein